MIWVVGIGGALGAVTRFLASNIIIKKSQKVYPFPVATLLINITGSFLLGFLTQLFLSNDIGDSFFYFGGVGFCGAFTTFSTFGYETITLIQLNKMKLAILYVTSSVIIGIISAMIGFYI